MRRQKYTIFFKRSGLNPNREKLEKWLNSRGIHKDAKFIDSLFCEKLLNLLVVEGVCAPGEDGEPGQAGEDGGVGDYGGQGLPGGPPHRHADHPALLLQPEGEEGEWAPGLVGAHGAPQQGATSSHASVPPSSPHSHLQSCNLHPQS